MPGLRGSRPGPAPPSAPRIPTERTLHGVTLTDDYAWMRDPAEPAFHAYLAAERAYYDACTRHLGGLTAELFQEASSRTTDDESVPWPYRGFLYRTRIPRGLEHGQFLRTRPADADEQVLLDENELAAATGYVDVGVRAPSPDGRALAWAVDTTGDERYTLRIRDLVSGRDLDDTVTGTWPEVAWSADSRHLFYLKSDPLNRPFQTWRHRIGADPRTDVVVFEEADARFDLTLHLSRSGGFVVIGSHSRDTSEVHLVPAGDPERAPVCIRRRQRGVEYAVDHAADPAGGAGKLFLVTNDDAVEFRLVTSPADRPGSWTEVACEPCWPARTDTRLVDCAVFPGHLLLSLRRSGSPLLAVTDHAGRAAREVAPANPAGSIAVDHAEDYDRGAVIVVEQTLVDPPVWSELKLDTGVRRELRRQPVPGYEPGRYATHRYTAAAADGTAVPVTLAHRADVALDGTAPCLLYGYGAYESCEFGEFDLSLPSLLDRGVVYAVAHVRGGGELGRRWWLDGRLRRKPNTFDDFVAVADSLAQPAHGEPRARVEGSRIVSRGLSAGGLLQGAVYSRAPARWRAVVAEVPFVDCVTTMLDPDIPLTVNEWDEWGDPRDPEDFACLRSYSPYDNPPAGRRPTLLVTGSVHDARVLVHEPAKWVARLRATDTSGSTLLFRVELGAGAHTGPSGRFAHLRYEAEVGAFVLDAMGSPTRLPDPAGPAG